MGKMGQMQIGLSLPRTAGKLIFLGFLGFHRTKHIGCSINKQIYQGDVQIGIAIHKLITFFLLQVTVGVEGMFGVE